MTGNRALLVSVTGARTTVDVCVDADVPVFQLLPTLLELVEPERAAGNAGHARWRLLDGEGRLVPPRATLAAAGVLDGQDLRIVTEGSGGFDR
jgi:hypothetical protein